MQERAVEGDAAHAALPALARVAPGLFYGWWVAIGACLISFVCAGVGFYSQGVLLDALCHDRGWSRASVSGATSVYFIVSGPIGLGVGRGVDRFGPRGFIALGAPLLAVALVGIGQTGSPAALYGWALAMALGASLAGAVPTTAIVTRWFSELRARAMTVSQTGVSIGGILLVPLSTWLIRERGLPVATELLAALVVAIALPVTAFVLRASPQPYGLEVDGPARARARAASGVPFVDVSFRTREALRTRAFWGLALGFGLGLFAQVGFLAHQLAGLRERLEPADAAFAVSTTAFGSVVGRLVLGPMADRLEKRRIAIGLFLVQACATLFFARASGGLALGAASFAFGLTMGNIFMLQPLLVGEFFGVSSFASVLGSLQVLTQLATGLGPFAVGLAFERAGGYERPLEGLAGVALCAALVLSRVRAPEPPSQYAVSPASR
ncbi:MAG TPA: MFS transporter [Myxococcota bacterium]|nr:MFS transporter [Myxococcota bacterium]